MKFTCLKSTSSSKLWSDIRKIKLYFKVSHVQLDFMLELYVVIAPVAWTDFRFCWYIVIPIKYFASCINVLFFMCVTEIVKITPNITEVFYCYFKNGRNLCETFNCTRETFTWLSYFHINVSKWFSQLWIRFILIFLEMTSFLHQIIW